MDLQTANRLYEYRKANGYSQEELAEKIGVSRQAISKWERSESSPDTDNLIALARLYGVSIDELINGTQAPEPAQAEAPVQKQEEQERVSVTPSGINVQTAQGDTAHTGADGVKPGEGNSPQFNEQVFERSEKKSGFASTAIWVSAIAAYLLLGFYTASGWAIGWILFLLAVCLDTGISAYKTKNLAGFAYPVLTVAVYCALGMAYSIWSPSWIVFLTIPLYYILCGAFAKSESLSVNSRKTILALISVFMCAVMCFTLFAVCKGSVEGRRSHSSPSVFDYDDDEDYTIADSEVSLTGVNAISVDWVNGNIRVTEGDGYGVTFSETAQTDSDLMLRYKLEDGKLNIQFCKSHMTFKWLESINKDLVITVPEGELAKLDIDSVNANIDIENISLASLKLDTVNGVINASGYIGKLDFDNVNAQSTFTFAKAPSQIGIDTVNGNCELWLPEDIKGFTLKCDNVSGNTDFTDFVGTVERNKIRTYGDGSTKINVDSVSGNLTIKASAATQ